jgi:hypothetical protein
MISKREEGRGRISFSVLDLEVFALDHAWRVGSSSPTGWAAWVLLSLRGEASPARYEREIGFDNGSGGSNWISNEVHRMESVHNLVLTHGIDMAATALLEGHGLSRRFGR